ncbi:hypothetical protein BH18ACT15_BH18ACT15_00920 [soil metagenome]
MTTAGSKARALPPDLIRGLLRAAWIVERARTNVYERWAGEATRFRAWAERTSERSAIIAEELAARNGEPDHSFVAPHTRWMESVTGATPTEVPLAEMLLVRFGDWVQAHTVHFLAGSVERFRALGEMEHSSVVWPSQLAPASPFEPVKTPRVEAPGSARLRIGILGDLHIGSPGSEELVGAAVHDLNASGAQLVIQLGDVADHGERTEMEAARNLLSGLDMPWEVIIGNHDVYSVSADRLSGSGDFTEVFGRSPRGRVIEHAGWRMLLLDSAANMPSPFAPFNLLTGSFAEGRGGAIAQGAISVEQHDLLADVADPDAGPAFIFLHHPPQPFTAFPPLIFGLDERDSGRLHAVTDSGNIWGVFAGHTHRNARLHAFSDAPVQEVSAPRDYPFGYALLDVGDDGYTFRFLQISDRALLQRAYEGAGAAQRRYSVGRPEERAWSWRRSSLP